MNGNNDFFGGSINPPPVPSPGTQQNTNVYAPPGSPAGALPSSASPAIPVFLVLVGALLAVAGFIGFRVMTSGTDIVLPDELLGMERVDPDSPIQQEVERSWSEVESYIGKDVEMHIGSYTSGSQGLIVVAGEGGVGDAGEQDDYFSGFAKGFTESMPQAQFTEAEAGSHGGRMQCVDMPGAGGACTWVSQETFGIVVVLSPTADIAESTRTVREAIES